MEGWKKFVTDLFLNKIRLKVYWILYEIRHKKIQTDMTSHYQCFRFK